MLVTPHHLKLLLLYREKNGYSQEEVADALDKAARVSEFESGKSNPTLETITSIASSINVDIEYLFDFSNLRQSEEYFEKESLPKIHYDTLAKHDIEDIKYIIDSTNIFIDYLNKKKI